MFGAGFDDRVATADEMSIVIVVPARNRMNDRIAGIADGAEQSIDEGRPPERPGFHPSQIPAPAWFSGRRNRFTQVQVAFRGRVVGKMFPVKLLQWVFGSFGMGKMEGSKSPTVKL